MAVNVADLRVRFSADTRDAERGIDSLNKKINSNLKSMGDSLTSVGSKLSLAVTAPLVGIAATALNSAAKFEQSMNLIQAVTGATGDQMKAMQNEAIELGAKTVFSAGEAAQGLLELSKSGLTAQQSMEAIPGVLDLAAAGALSVASAAEITSNALNSFHLKATQAGEISNMLAAAANASSLEVSDMAQSFAASSSVFASYGQNIYDLSTALALLGNNGIKGSDAGTSLKTMMSSLAAPTIGARKLMASLGIQVYDTAGNMRLLPDIMQSVQAGLKGLTEQQRNAALYKIFGSDALRAANILLKEGATGWDAMSEAVHKTGQAALLSDARMKGLAGAIEYWKGSVDSFLISAALPFQDFFSNIIRKAADLLTSLGSLSDGTKRWIIGIAAGAAALGPLLLGVGSLARLTAFALPSLIRMIPAVRAITIAFGLLYGAYKLNIFGFRDLVNNGLKRIQAAAPLAGAALGELVDRFKYAGTNTFYTNDAIYKFTEALTGSKDIAASVSNTIVGLIGRLGNAQRAFAQAGGGANGFFAALGSLSGGALKVDVSGLVTTLTWGDFVGVLDWGRYIFQIRWGDFIGILSWNDKILMLKWGDFLAKFDWGNWAVSLKWGDYVGELSWTDVVTTFNGWGNYIEHLTWKQFITDAINWGTWIIALDWTVFIKTLEWGAYIVGFAWSEWISKINWTSHIPQMTWSNFVENLVWASRLPALAWNDFITNLEWFGVIDKVAWNSFISSLTWNNFIVKLDDWGTYIGKLTWSGIVTAFDWSVYVGKLAWSEFVASLANWGTYITSLDWGSYITKISNWGAYIGSLAWSEWITKIDWSNWINSLSWSDFITYLNWGDFVSRISWSDVVSTLSDWGPFVGKLTWASVITSLEWSLYVTKIAWTDYVAPLTWGSVLTIIDWNQYATKLVWSEFITKLTWTNVSTFNWAEFIPKLTWLNYITPVGWLTYIAQLTWDTYVKPLSWAQLAEKLNWLNFVTPVGWLNYIAVLTWDKFVSPVSWDAFVEKLTWSNFVNAFSWSEFLEKLAWSAFVPSMSWASFITSIDLRSYVPSFPGWTAIFSALGFGGAPVQGSPAPAKDDLEVFFGNAAGTSNFAGGWTWVGERGAELMKLPRGTQIASHENSMKMIGHMADGNFTTMPPLLMPTAGKAISAQFINVKGNDKILAEMVASHNQLVDISKSGYTGPQKIIQSQDKNAQKLVQVTESFLQSVPGLFKTSPVTQQQMDLAKLGVPQNFADDWIRQLTDTVVNGVHWDGVDIKDAAARAGLDPGLPAKAILEMVTQKWNDQSLFADKKNLDLINMDAIKQAMAQQAASKLGQQNIFALFGIQPEQAQGQAVSLGNTVGIGVQQGLTDTLSKVSSKDGKGIDMGSGLVNALKASLTDSTAFDTVGPAILKAIADSWKTINTDVDFVGGLATAFDVQLSTKNAIESFKAIGGKIAQILKQGIDEYFKNAAIADAIAKNMKPTAPQNGIPASEIPKNALGTSYWRGGLSWVGERGAELVNLPRGAQVIPHNRSMQMAGAGGNTYNVTVNAAVDSKIDVHDLAYRVVSILKRKGG